MAKEDTPLKEEIIPLNFVGSGRCFNNMFKTVNLVEACVMAVPGLFLTLKVIHFSSIRTQIYVGLILSALPFALGIIGINDEDILTYLFNLAKFWKSRRIAKFNPRAKAELHPDYIYKSDAELPRDKLERFIAAITNGKFDNEQDLSPDISSPVYKTFFAEDVDIAGQYGAPELPDELKSPKQLKKEAKERKRQQALQEKENAKKQRELARLQKKQHNK